MRILLVTQYFYPEVFKSNDLAFELARRGHHVDALVGIPNYPEGKASWKEALVPYWIDQGHADGNSTWWCNSCFFQLCILPWFLLCGV